MTSDEFKPIMARVESWWLGSKWDVADITTWFEDLSRFDAVDVRVAFERLKRSHLSPFAPGIGQVLELLEQRDADAVPMLDEILEFLRRAARGTTDPVTGRYPERELCWAVEANLGALAARLVELMTANALLTATTSLGGFERRDAQNTWDRLVASWREGEIKAEAIASVGPGRAPRQLENAMAQIARQAT